MAYVRPSLSLFYGNTVWGFLIPALSRSSCTWYNLSCLPTCSGCAPSTKYNLRLVLTTSAYVNFSLPVRFASRAHFHQGFMNNTYGAMGTVSWEGCSHVIPALAGQLNIPQCVWLATYQITVKGCSSSITWWLSSFSSALQLESPEAFQRYLPLYWTSSADNQQLKANHLTSWDTPEDHQGCEPSNSYLQLPKIQRQSVKDNGR